MSWVGLTSELDCSDSTMSCDTLAGEDLWDIPVSLAEEPSK